MKILFIGASGMLGKPVALEMIRSGFEVSLLARDPGKMKALFPDTAVLKGDVFDKVSLNASMKGMDAVYCNLSVFPHSKQKDLQPEREGISNIIEAAKQNAVKRIAYLSSLVHRYEGINDFHWWAFQIKSEAVQKIRSSGIPFTIFYPSTFMECLPYQMMRGKKIGLLGRSEMPMWFVAAEDYARQVVRSFRQLTNENREYSIQGPEGLKTDEAVKIFIDNYSKNKLSTMSAPVGIIKFMGVFNQKMNYAWHICEALNKYPEQFESENSWSELGKPEITVKKYAELLSK